MLLLLLGMTYCFRKQTLNFRSLVQKVKEPRDSILNKPPERRSVEVKRSGKRGSLYKTLISACIPKAHLLRREPIRGTKTWLPLPGRSFGSRDPAEFNRGELSLIDRSRSGQWGWDGRRFGNDRAPAGMAKWTLLVDLSATRGWNPSVYWLPWRIIVVPLVWTLLDTLGRWTPDQSYPACSTRGCANCWLPDRPDGFAFHLAVLLKLGVLFVDLHLMVMWFSDCKGCAANWGDLSSLNGLSDQSSLFSVCGWGWQASSARKNTVSPYIWISGLSITCSILFVLLLIQKLRISLDTKILGNRATVTNNNDRSDF